MPPAARQDRCDHLAEFMAAVRSKPCPHVALFIGSMISCAGEAPCASAPAIKSELILKPLQDLLRARSSELDLQAAAVVSEMIDGPRLAQNIKALPFEVFMNALDQVAPEVAMKVIRAACGTGESNHNHELCADLAVGLLESEVANRVTIFTTNYDNGMDASLRLRAVLEPDPECRGSIPAFLGRTPTGRVFRYVKLHGCLTRPETLVFTTKQLAPNIFDPTALRELFEHVGDVDAWAFVGYGFNDPDLRRVLGPRLRHSTVVRNERQKWEGTLAPWAEQLTPPFSSGPDVLQGEFLSGPLAPEQIEYRSDLFADSNGQLRAEHILKRLCSELAGLASPLDRGSMHKEYTDGMVDASRLALNDLDSNQIVDFLARLADACNNDITRGLIGQALLDERMRPTASRLRILCEQAGHVGDYDAGIDLCIQLRDRFQDNESQACVLAIESFFQSVGKRQVWIAVRRALAAAMRLPACGPEARAVVRHYVLHLWLKGLQKVQLRWSVPRWICWSPGVMIAWRLNCVAGWTRADNDILFTAKVEDLVAQALSMGGRHRAAIRRARKVRMFYAMLGSLNQTPLADRTHGWAVLSTGCRSAQARAMRLFARGLGHALHSQAPDIAPKLAKNLLRLTGIPNDMGAATTADKESAMKACAHIRDTKMGNEIGPAEVIPVAAWWLGSLGDLSPEEQRRERDDLVTYADWRRFPVL